MSFVHFIARKKQLNAALKVCIPLVSTNAALAPQAKNSSNKWIRVKDISELYDALQ